jgi:ABC-2 type transport system ATP-binding protein
MASKEIVVETRKLTKIYRDFWGREKKVALRALNMEVYRGEIFGLLGPNGSGKTTTIKLLLGMARPSSGTATVFGLTAASPTDSVEIRRRTGFVGDDKGLYDGMTVGGMIRFTASFYPGWSPELEAKYLRRFELAATRSVKTLSRGMRTKLAVLLALCRGADLLVLDEPTTGLDPEATENVLQALVGHAADRGATVFFSSHQLADVEQIADRVAIVDRGRSVVAGALDALRESFCRVELVFDGEAPEVTPQAPGVERVRRRGRVLTLLSSAGAERVREEARAWNPVSVEVFPVTLKEIFLETAISED